MLIDIEFNMLIDIEFYMLIDIEYYMHIVLVLLQGKNWIFGMIHYSICKLYILYMNLPMQPVPRKAFASADCVVREI